tara:strand:+ start:32 stop:238 length:207 start_codon:yes stop_codon:yes gene_type:complete
MGVAMKALSRLPLEEQERVLEELSDEARALKTCPIEIDGVFYVIPQGVFDLIESLHFEIQELHELGVP